jgi:hypothetical protein
MARAEKNDSSEIATHLRTVHFSLFLACILAALSVYGYSPTRVNSIQEQFQHIMKIKTNWMTWTKRFGTEQIKWLKDQGLTWPDRVPGDIHIPSQELSREKLPQGDLGWTARPIYSPIYLYLSVNTPSGSRHEILGAGWPRDDGTELIPGVYDAVGNLRLDTLDDFRHFWNASDHVEAFVVKDVSENAYLVSKGEVKATLPWVSSPKTRQGTQLKLGRMDIGLMEGGDYCKDIKELLSRWRSRFNVLFCGQAPPPANEPPLQVLVLPASYKSQSVPVNLRVWLAEHFKFPAVGKKFEETFPELHDFTKMNPKMSLDDVSRLLQSELKRERSSEKIEFLGLKFPESDLATWGAVIIVVIQLYFWLHLRTLKQRITYSDASRRVAWIGLYPDAFARAVSLLTACILPAAVIVYGIWTLGFSYYSLVPLTFGGLLAIATAVLLRGIVNRVNYSMSTPIRESKPERPSDTSPMPPKSSA